MSIELRDLVREVVGDHPHADPRELARHVAKLTPEADVMSFYQEALVDYTASVLRTSRNQALSSTRSRSTYSKKLERCRDGWKALCAAPVHVGGTVWKLLGDCTIADLQFCATERREKAARNIERAEDYERFAALMDEHNVTMFRDLPPEAVVG